TRGPATMSASPRNHGARKIAAARPSRLLLGPLAPAPLSPRPLRPPRPLRSWESSAIADMTPPLSCAGGPRAGVGVVHRFSSADLHRLPEIEGPRRRGPVDLSPARLAVLTSRAVAETLTT